MPPKEETRNSPYIKNERGNQVSIGDANSNDSQRGRTFINYLIDNQGFGRNMSLEEINRNLPQLYQKINGKEKKASYTRGDLEFIQSKLNGSKRAPDKSRSNSISDFPREAGTLSVRGLSPKRRSPSSTSANVDDLNVDEYLRFNPYIQSPRLPGSEEDDSYPIMPSPLSGSASSAVIQPQPPGIFIPISSLVGSPGLTNLTGSPKPGSPKPGSLRNFSSSPPVMPRTSSWDMLNIEKFISPTPYENNLDLDQTFEMLNESEKKGKGKGTDSSSSMIRGISSSSSSSKKRRRSPSPKSRRSPSPKSKSPKRNNVSSSSKSSSKSSGMRITLPCWGKIVIHAVPDWDPDEKGIIQTAENGENLFRIICGEEIKVVAEGEPKVWTRG